MRINPFGRRKSVPTKLRMGLLFLLLFTLAGCELGASLGREIAIELAGDFIKGLRE